MEFSSVIGQAGRSADGAARSYRQLVLRAINSLTARGGSRGTGKRGKSSKYSHGSTCTQVGLFLSLLDLPLSKGLTRSPEPTASQSGPVLIAKQLCGSAGDQFCNTPNLGRPKVSLKIPPNFDEKSAFRENAKFPK